MSDEQIMDALARCAKLDFEFAECENCPYKGNCGEGSNNFLQDVIDLINRKEKELVITRSYIHDNNLEWDLLSYSQKKENNHE